MPTHIHLIHLIRKQQSVSSSTYTLKYLLMQNFYSEELKPSIAFDAFPIACILMKFASFATNETLYPLYSRISFQFILSYVCNIYHYIGSTARIKNKRTKNKLKKYDFLRHCVALEHTCHGAGEKRMQVISLIVYSATCTCNKNNRNPIPSPLLFLKRQHWAIAISYCNIVWFASFAPSFVVCFRNNFFISFFALSYLHYNCKRWG